MEDGLPEIPGAAVLKGGGRAHRMAALQGLRAVRGGSGVQSPGVKPWSPRPSTLSLRPPNTCIWTRAGLCQSVHWALEK